ncbi:MAG: response regulator [Candidatus Falkowbacteria bacterium]|nr:response regulator [Candidatus Falkowbacteria bacterium]
MSKRIFIIEDDTNILYALEAQFAAEEFIVETSDGEEDPEELFNRLRKFSPDIIVLDVILPTSDGFDVLKKIKEDDELNEAQIFVFTDISDEDNKHRSLQMGADYFFFKEDFDTYEFVEKVKKIVKNVTKETPEDDDRDYEE